MSAPFPTDLTAAPKGGTVAWVLDQNGARNIWVAEAPDYKGHRITDYRDDDGQEIAQIAWTPDGRSIIFVRGGDFETFRDNPNPASLPQGVEQDIWIIPATGGAPRKIAEGSQPAVSPKGDRIAFLKKDEIWSIGLTKTTPNPRSSSTPRAKPANSAGPPMARASPSSPPAPITLSSPFITPRAKSLALPRPQRRP